MGTAKYDNLYVCGLPIDEVVKVLTFYKTTKVMPTKDYVDGFEAGVKAAYEECNKQLQNALYNLL